MIEVRIIKGKLHLFKDSVLQFKLGQDMVYAELNNEENLILITTDSGTVELREITGKFIRNIGQGDTHIAKWLGSNITLINKKGIADYREITNFTPAVL